MECMQLLASSFALLSFSCLIFFFFFLLFSFFLATRGIFSSPTRDQTRDPALEAQSPDRWTTREVPITHCFLHLTFFLSVTVWTFIHPGEYIVFLFFWLLFHCIDILLSKDIVQTFCLSIYQLMDSGNVSNLGLLGITLL